MVRFFDSSVPEVLPRPEYEAGQALYPSQSTLNQIPSLPPSFTTLLSGCFPDSTLGTFFIVSLLIWSLRHITLFHTFPLY